MFLESLAEDHSQESWSSYEGQLKSLQAQECQHKSSTYIRRIHGKGRNRGMTTVMVLDGSGEWKEVNECLDIKNSCMEGN